MKTTTISGLLMALTSILTSCGVTVYDSQFTQAVSHVAARAGATTTPDTGGHSPHVHSDYNPLSSLINNSFHHNAAVIGPRKRSHHKKLFELFEDPGRHAFDDVFMPKLYN